MRILFVEEEAPIARKPRRSVRILKRRPKVTRIRIGGEHRTEATDLRQADEQQHDRPDEKHGHVHRFRPQHGLHSADDGEDAVMTTRKSAADQKNGM